MLKIILIIVGLIVFAYVKRHGFRRAGYVLWTGDEHPDWEELGADYYIAGWERRSWEQHEVDRSGDKEVEHHDSEQTTPAS